MGADHTLLFMFVELLNDQIPDNETEFLVYCYQVARHISQSTGTYPFSLISMNAAELALQYIFGVFNNPSLDQKINVSLQVSIKSALE